jgi:2-polyprenyl-3-methyl-5-hydroxy-6-metoxy-1,4-benzoquinol methylase
MKCPACNSENTEIYLDTNLTTFFFPVSENLIKKINKEPIKLMICLSCSHIFQVDLNQKTLDLIYSEFYQHYNLDTSTEFQEVYRDRTVEFMANLLVNEKSQKVIDIGCGEGTYFPFFQEMGYDCFGLEPSEKAKIAKTNNPKAKIEQRYFESSDVNVFDTEFDVVFMNWALEHIMDIDSFFSTLDKYLKIGSKLVIQVPDLQYYLDNSLPLFYEHEHINYFSKETLSELLKRKGFRIVSAKNGDCPSLLICGEYIGSKDYKAESYKELVKTNLDFKNKSEQLRQTIQKTLSENDKIIIYGLGLVSFWISDYCLKEADFEKIELIDDNRFYHGKMVPSFNKKLKEYPPGQNIEDTLVIICTSPVYHKKIRNSIKHKFTGNYRVATIENNQILISNPSI